MWKFPSRWRCIRFPDREIIPKRYTISRLSVIFRQKYSRCMNCLQDGSRLEEVVRYIWGRKGKEYSGKENDGWYIRKPGGINDDIKAGSHLWIFFSCINISFHIVICFLVAELQNKYVEIINYAQFKQLKRWNIIVSTIRLMCLCLRSEDSELYT